MPRGGARHEELAMTKLTTRRLLVAVLFVAIFVMVASRGQPADTDTWWHLKSGQLMWQTGQLLKTDPFSHTAAGQPWIDHGWLVQVMLWPIYQTAGLAGLALWLAAMVTAAFALVYLQCEGRPFVAAFVTLLAAVASSVIWAVRPQIVSFLLAAVIAFLLYSYKRSGNSRTLWPIPLLVALWANCHAGFVVAFILMGCYLVSETLNGLTRPAAVPGASGRATEARPMALLVVMLASVPAVLINPNTGKMIPYAYQTVSIGPLQAFIQEWSAPDLHNLQLQPFIWLLLLTMAAMGLSRRRADWTDLVLMGVFGYMGLLAVRNVALFALVAAPILARHATAALDELALVPRLSWLGMLTHTLSSPRPRKSIAVLNTALLVVVLAAAAVVVGLSLTRMQDPDVWGEGLPVQAADYMRGHDMPGQMFNTYNWGGYLIWTLYPDQPVFIDGRTDLYAFGGVLDDYVQVHLARPGWREVLGKYQVGHIITERGGLLATVLDETEDWQEVYSDGPAAIYIRAGAAP
jgi:hypothetical protein